jgi:uncharacterized protein (DUF58 family)
MNNARTYLTPDAVSRLRNLELKARLVVEGFIAGLHRSPYHGFSAEFSEHRQYIPGDPPKIIDWRVYGRTNRFYVKQFREETNLKAYILLDCSASMGYSSGGLSKLEYGKCLSAALTYLLLGQRDAGGLVLFDSKIRNLIPPKSYQGYLNRILTALNETAAGGETAIGSLLHNIAERLKRRGLVILISDLLDDENEILNGLKHFRHNGHEVLVLHIVDPQEKDFGFKGNIRFKDLETRERLISLPEHLRDAYKFEFQTFTDFLQSGCREQRTDYALFTTDEAYDKALARYLIKRKKMR